MSTSHEHTAHQLHTALCALALPATEQIRVTAPGDVAAELYFDFRVALSSYADLWADQISSAQSHSLDRAAQALEAVPDQDFDDAALERASWDAVRVAARSALAALGWELVPPPPYIDERLGARG